MASRTQAGGGGTDAPGSQRSLGPAECEKEPEARDTFPAAAVTQVWERRASAGDRRDPRDMLRDAELRRMKGPN